jgi:hypothetical protein
VSRPKIEKEVADDEMKRAAGGEGSINDVQALREGGGETQCRPPPSDYSR